MISSREIISESETVELDCREKIGLIGRKVGMTRLFDDGVSTPVTILDVSNNKIVQIKNMESDGYCAIQISYGEQHKRSRLKKAIIGHHAKSGTEVGLYTKEFRLGISSNLAKYTLGEIIEMSTVFSAGQKVDVRGTTIGKGFAGSIKRHHFSSQRASHGNSRSHRAPGSIGQAQDPGRVFPGKRMPGHLGNNGRTVQSLLIMRTDPERNLLWVKGAVPGHANGFVLVYHSVKCSDNIKN